MASNIWIVKEMDPQKQKETIERTVQFVQEELKDDSSGHDWWHVYRVWKSSIYIGKRENGNLFIVQLAALLHDIADWKFNDGDLEKGPLLAQKWLQSLNVDEDSINHICNIIREISFKGAGIETKMSSLEGEIVQDADRLDAIGAIGIGRTFAYGGHKGRLMYDPYVKPKFHETFEDYKTSQSPTINHFYEKLLLLKNLMNTQTAKAVAQKRHEFMEIFLSRFLQEWDGKDITNLGNTTR